MLTELVDSKTYEENRRIKRIARPKSLFIVQTKELIINSSFVKKSDHNDQRKYHFSQE